MRTDSIGLYVHVPFCVKKCNYCDFCSYPIESIGSRDAYIESLCREIEAYKGQEIRANTLFFGGGTPSLLTPEQFDKIVRSIKESFTFDKNIEFTVEANPVTLNCDNLSAYIAGGVNRISIGLQSVHNNELKILGRIHSYEDFLASYRLVRDFGINNVNVDIMYGLPEQTVESFSDTLRTISALSPEHISVYGLILEEGTPFYNFKGTLTFPSEDEECDMYYTAASMLRELGYSHYEISNYSKSGYESRHNLNYWRDGEYLGFGVAAYSYYNGMRFGNCSDINEYLRSDSSVAYSERIDEVARRYEYAMLALRLSEGICLSDYRDKFGIDFLKGREMKISELERLGYLVVDVDRLYLTEKGFYVSNLILSELL